MNVYIRPLCVKDALKSSHWRNDPEVWTYTNSRPDHYITQDIELEWIRIALKNEASKHFAICIVGTNEYIGNTQLTNISNFSAQFHIFIGNKIYWGRGISTLVTSMVLDFAHNNLNLKKIYLEVNKKNAAAINSYKKNDFKIISSCDETYKMEVMLK
jgi:RimJ/RimL family protein N-acetyltransferase